MDKLKGLVIFNNLLSINVFSSVINHIQNILVFK